jgi:hypothetical protein
MLRKILGCKNKEVTGGLIKLHNDWPPNSYYCADIVGMITRRRMGWAGHVARMGKVRFACKILVSNVNGRRRST